MAEKVGDAYVELGTRDQKLVMGLSRGLRSVQSFAIAASGILAGVAAGKGITGLVKEYSNAVETVNKFNEVFSGASQDINKAAKDLAKNYGLIGTSSRKLLADTGDILVGFGFAEDAALDLAVQTNKLAVDLASFTNIEGGSARASQALTSLLVGQTEKAQALGIVIRQGTTEYKERTKVIMKENGVSLLQAKAMNNIEIAFSQTKKAQGDYARTQDQLANQIRLVGENADDVKESFGGLIVQFISADSRVYKLNESLAGLAQRLKDVDTASIETTKDMIKVAGTIGLVTVAVVKLTPLIIQFAKTIKIAALSVGSIGAALGGLLIIAGAFSLGKVITEFVKMRQAANQAQKALDNLNINKAKMKEALGTSNVGLLDDIRKAIQSNDVAALDWLSKNMPEVYRKTQAAYGAGIGTPKDAAKDAATIETKPIQAAFVSFQDAIRNIQTSLKGDKEAARDRKKGLGFLGSIDQGIEEIATSLGNNAVVGL